MFDSIWLCTKLVHFLAHASVLLVHFRNFQIDMSSNERVDWNQLMDDEECTQIEGETSRPTVEQPLSSPEVEHRSTEGSFNSSGDEYERNVLELYCDEKDDEFFRELSDSNSSTPSYEPIQYNKRASLYTTTKQSQRGPSVRHERDNYGVRVLNNNTSTTDDGSRTTAVVPGYTSSPSTRTQQSNRGQLGGKNRPAGRKTLNSSKPTFGSALPKPRRVSQKKAIYKTRYSKRIADPVTRKVVGRGIAVRWIRHGFESLVYDICNCNEAPNVVFAGMCFSQADIYTMVLRNCDGKRRYWYDKTSRRNPQPAKGTQFSDFERAMRWRANSVGRATSSPGYDLASYVLQNVATDKRFSGTTTPLIIVTTDNMLDDPTINSQLVYANNRSVTFHSNNNHARSVVQWQSLKPTPCYLCRASSTIVTHDNASVPTFTCLQHSASNMVSACADTTRVCNAVIVNVQFLRNEEHASGAEFVCRLRLIQNGRTQPTATVRGSTHSQGFHDSDYGALTIAELVSLPFGVHPSDLHMVAAAECSYKASEEVNLLELDTVHESTCRDSHYNIEDLFPSMPINSNGGIHYYDTKIGLAVDRLYCLASNFQR